MTAIAIPARQRAGAAPSHRLRRSPETRPAPLALVEAPSRRAAKQRRRLTALGSAAVLAVFTIVAFHALLAQSQVAIDRLDRSTAAAEQRYEQARYEHAVLASPERIVQRAAELGLVAPAGPPTAIPVANDLPAPPEGTSSTLHGWTEVKPTLVAAP
jgi:hypothetical protein